MKRRLRRTVAQAYNTVAPGYDISFDSKIIHAEHDALFRWIRWLGCARGKVIDLGCGTGLALQYLKKSKEDYLGVDVSPGMLKQARLKFPLHDFLEADMSDTGLPSECADSVISTNGGASYVTDTEQLVREISRILKPGGKYCVMVYGEASRDCADIVELCGFDVDVVFYTAASLRSAFNYLFDHVRVRGFEYARRSYPQSMTRNQMALLTSLEIEILGRLRPDDCISLVAYGKRYD